MLGGIRQNNAFVDEWIKIHKNDPTSEEAQDLWSRSVRPARIKAGLGGTAAVVGLGGAVGTMLLVDLQPGGGMIRLAGEF
jgi:hypothetical protein